MFRSAQIFLIGCLSVIAGVALGKLVKVDNLLLYLVFLTSALAFFFLFQIFRHQKLAVFFLVLAGAVLGLWRFNLTRPTDNSVAFWPEERTFFTGVVADSPQIKNETQKIIVEKIIKNNKSFSGSVLVNSALFPAFGVGDRIQVNCDLKVPEQIDNFNYAGYLADRDVYKVCYFPELKNLGQNPNKSTPEKIKYFFNNLRETLAIRANNFLSSPTSALNLAMILGERNELTEELNNYFSNSGVIHIISISGTHIALLSALIFQLFLLLGMSRQKSFNFIVVILVLYLFLIGFNAPAIRSALMGLIVAFAQKEGRLASAGRAVVASAVFLLLLNPRLLLGDIGFQLSFLAVFGLVYISPYISHFLRRIVRNKNLLSVLAMTLAAQIITWPLTVWRFQTISIIAPLTNILILAVPAVEVLMIAGFLYIFAAGFGLGAPLIFLFSAPVYLSANYVIYVSEFCAKIPFGHLPINNFNFLWVLVSYAVMGMIYFMVRRKVILEE